MKVQWGRWRSAILRHCRRLGIGKVWIPKFLKRTVVRGDRLKECVVMIVGNIKFFRRFLNNWTKRRIVNAAYFGKQMMFNLKI